MNAPASLMLLADTQTVLSWLRQHGVTELAVDSRQVGARAALGARVAFIAWPGTAEDGRAFVASALADGAAACLVELDGAPAWGFTDERIVAVQGLKARLAEIAHQFHGRPSDQLDVVAVTGTNGKTSTAWWTAQALSRLGRPCGVIGTLGVGQPGSGQFQPTGLTTPDPVTLHATFRAFVEGGLKAAAIEASSIGIEEGRLDATRIKVAQFTNFTQDHLDYHGSMQAYWRSKRALFAWPGLEAAVVNADDGRGDDLVALSCERGLALWTYSLHVPARLRVKALTIGVDGLDVLVQEFDEALAKPVSEARAAVPLIGEFNVSNLLAVLGGLRALGVPLQDAAQACAHLSPVPGRMQAIKLPDAEPLSLPLALVDYAHTPDALQKALLALRGITKARGGQLWCVFGCGGNRDPLKRPLMGAMAEQYADQVVLTSDNPRLESPAYILSQILAGVARHDGVAVIENRHEAIAHALRLAAPQDVVLIAGKGHEAYQDASGVKTPFSDIDEAMNALRARRAA